MIHPPHALITGGSRGIGLATAYLFASHGYRCTLLARSESVLKTAVASLPPLSLPAHQEEKGDSNLSSYYKHAYIPACINANPDIWSTETTLHCGNEVGRGKKFAAYLPPPPRSHASHPSRIDVLINCAGTAQSSLLTTTPSSAIEDILNTNLTGLILSTRFLLRKAYLRRVLKSRSAGTDSSRFSTNSKDIPLCKVLERDGSVIVNVASLLGVKGGYGAVAYAAAKAGVLGFTRALATEYAGTGVRVNAVVPGYVATDMTKGLNRTDLEKQIPLGRFGTPEEIAHAVLFLVQNKYAHNCVLNLDGGLSAA